MKTRTGTVFTVNPNPDKTFNPNLKYSDLRGKGFDFLVQAFEERIKRWYILQAKDVDSKMRHQGFIVTTIACLIIDLLSQYIYNLKSSNAKYYKQFLKDYIPEFKQNLCQSIESFNYDKGSKQWQRIQIRDLADAFYHGFRCSIVHNSAILDYGRISGADIVGSGKIICQRQWGEGVTEVAVNPTELINKIDQIFTAYIKDLLNPDNKKLRCSFGSKFERDFGIPVTP